MLEETEGRARLALALRCGVGVDGKSSSPSSRYSCAACVVLYLGRFEALRALGVLGVCAIFLQIASSCAALGVEFGIDNDLRAAVTLNKRGKYDTTRN